MKIKVLLVDDEEEFAEALAKRLELRDFRVTTAFSGKSALELIKKIDFDVIILDIMMPELSGDEALKEIKHIKPLTEIIMLTGEATVENAIESMKEGAFDFLMKPVETEVLAAKIKIAHKIKSEHENRIREAEIGNILERRGW